MTLFPRSSGILLHPTSLPGRYGIGDLGNNAYQFVDWLAAAGQSIWQILPLGPTSYGDSPYQTLSAFAGNPNLISLDKLVEAGWLTTDDLADTPDFPREKVDYGWIIGFHETKLHLAYQRFQAQADEKTRKAFTNWSRDNAAWLEDFALFVTIKNKNGGKPWTDWEDQGESLYKPDALKQARAAHADAIDEQRFRQWVFFTQWYELKYYANHKGVRLFGDIPIFVAHDSADVWSNKGEYFLDEKGLPTVIAGVPPDYFSPTGQRWGNPLYRWDKMKATGYQWWLARVKAILSLVDYVRIDHFRGFEAYWEIPATEETAIKGNWVTGPQAEFFQVLQNAFGDLPIIAEDLGVITEGVEKIRDTFNLPGMKVLQFAWSDPTNAFLPHNHPVNCIVYTGTHDNNTTIGWWLNEISDQARQFMQDYLSKEVYEINWEMIRIAMRSAAHTAVFPMQDILNLGAQARMNTPGVMSGNWAWRFTTEMLPQDAHARLAHLTWLYQRRPDQREKQYGDVAMKQDNQ
jgi:4-alpha-glucanotransferase